MHTPNPLLLIPASATMVIFNINIKASLPAFLFFLSTLFLSSSSLLFTINLDRHQIIHRQKCKSSSICSGSFNNSRFYKDPREEYFYCWQSCQQSDDPEQCDAQCRERLDEQLKEEAGQKGQQGEQEEGEEEASINPNPYYFPKYFLQPRFVAEHGGYNVLAAFRSLSPFLRGVVKNYRLALFQILPGTFLLPYHLDAESVFVVWSGSGTLSVVMKDKKESFKIEDGDVIRVPAGANIYLINDHTSDVLGLTELIRLVNIPGQFEEFFSAGFKNPDPELDYTVLRDVESYFSVFSNDILEAAFDTPREQLAKAFGQQRKEGMIIKASEEKLSALSKKASSSVWRKLIPSSKDTEFKFNLQSQKPVHSNNYGKFYEAPPQEFKQLQDMNVSVIFADIYPGAMMVPHYNSKETYVFMVVNGMGYFEMASPRFTMPESEEEVEYLEDQREESGVYRKVKVSGKLSLGDVFVVPAGYPVAIVAQNDNNADRNQNLRLVGFGINARNNIRNFLAGQEGNILKQMEREAKQLTFGQEMEQILTNQKQSYFVPTQNSGQ